MLNVNICFGSLNVRGLRESVKRKALFLYCKGQKSNCIFLQETHSSDSDVSFWSNQWGSKILFSHGSTRSGGVAILFNNFPGDLVIQRTDLNGHWLIAVMRVESLFFILVNVYGYNNESQNKNMLEDITLNIFELKDRYPTEYILMGGDWNMTPDEWIDRWPSRTGRPQKNNLIIEFLINNNLTDIWRVRNPGIKSFSWFKPNGACKSRIDYWLGSDNILNHTVKVVMSNAPLSDHCFIELCLESEIRQSNKRTYWKFNAKLLQNQDYCNIVKKIIKDIMADRLIVGYISKWEFIKFKIREFSIQFSKNTSRKQREYECKLFQEITYYCSKDDLNSQERSKLMELQTKLDQLYLNKAEGAFVRSRAGWIEEGERNSSYFFNLEKSRQKRNFISSLLIDGIECDDPKILENETYTFYSNLYSSQFSQADCDAFFDQIDKLIPKIDESFKEFCESDFRIEELDASVKKMALNKSPGPDGLTVNFFQFFWEDLREILFKAILASIEKGELMSSMKQGLITLIPKPTKDKQQLDNLRPITLLNTDYKIFSSSIATRLKQGVSSIISETQSGFLKDRNIHNNIRLVLDLLDYNDLISDDSFILFLDFYKAFDSVEHPFILETLTRFGFEDKFRKIIDILYNDINSSVSLGYGTGKRFSVKRGIRQGCGSSPLLFIMVVEMLAILIKNSSVAGIEIMDNFLIISQLADDTTLFLKNEHQIPLVKQIINTFSKASGLKLNLNKCELLVLKECHSQLLYDIKVKKEVKYLGITISKDHKVLEKVNISDNVDKCKTILNKWLQRDITIFGRILLTKMDSLSRFIYPAYSLSISNKVIKTINSLNFNFIWRNKCHYISKDDLVKPYIEGGGNAIDFDIMNGVLKLKWLKSFLNNPHSIWFFIPSKVFNTLGGIDFLLKCDFEITKLPVKLSEFHKQVLLYWKMLFKHNFTPHNSPIWNNRYILMNRKSIFIQDWLSKGVWAIAHFVDKEGHVLEHQDFCQKFNIQCSKSKFNKIHSTVT